MKRIQIMWLVLIFAALFAFFVGVAFSAPKHVQPLAAPAFYINGSTQYERDRIVKLESSLHFNGIPMVGTWTITILDENDWDWMKRQYNVNDTESAFTLLWQDHTFIHEAYLLYANDTRVKRTIAHESGHLACSCESEETANSIADVLEGKK